MRNAVIILGVVVGFRVAAEWLLFLFIGAPLYMGTLAVVLFVMGSLIIAFACFIYSFYSASKKQILESAAFFY
jgi:ABC-type antimicrobial peptide transport system permease subunit